MVGWLIWTQGLLHLCCREMETNKIFHTKEKTTRNNRFSRSVWLNGAFNHHGGYLRHWNCCPVQANHWNSSFVLTNVTFCYLCITVLTKRSLLQLRPEISVTGGLKKFLKKIWGFSQKESSNGNERKSKKSVECYWVRYKTNRKTIKGKITSHDPQKKLIF